MRHVTEAWKNTRPLAARRLAGAGFAAILALAGIQQVHAAEGVAPCATPASLAGAPGSADLVGRQSEDLIVAIRPDNPRVGRPVIAWIVGHQPGRLLIARRINWDFNNAASMLKNSGGGSASTIYLTPGTKTISVSVIGLSGKKKTATCSFSVSW